MNAKIEQNYKKVVVTPQRKGKCTKEEAHYQNVWDFKKWYMLV
jgi:hypothetical protein